MLTEIKNDQVKNKLSTYSRTVLPHKDHYLSLVFIISTLKRLLWCQVSNWENLGWSFHSAMIFYLYCNIEKSIHLLFSKVTDFRKKEVKALKNTWCGLTQGKLTLSDPEWEINCSKSQTTYIFTSRVKWNAALTHFSQLWRKQTEERGRITIAKG